MILTDACLYAVGNIHIISLSENPPARIEVKPWMELLL